MPAEAAALENQYWISFQQDDYLFDVKYQVPDVTVDDDPDLLIPLIGKLAFWFE